MMNEQAMSEQEWRRAEQLRLEHENGMHRDIRHGDCETCAILSQPDPYR